MCPKLGQTLGYGIIDTMLASSQTQFSVYSSVRSIFRLYSNPRSE